MEAIEASKCFVLVYTKDSNQSRDVANEITAAFKARIPILPLRIEDVEMEPALAYYLNGIHWLDALTFLDTLTNVPASAADASALGNGKVKAWAVFAETADIVTAEDPEEPTSPTAVESTDLYHLYIAAEGGVWAPADSTYLFAYLPNLTSIDCGTSFRTDHVQTMSNMFRDCRSLTELDVSGFDTSKVAQHGYFMNPGILVNGEPWEALFS